LAAWAGSAQAAEAPFSEKSDWSVEESWNSDTLVYTFYPNCMFRSSDWDGGKGLGTWSVDGKQLIMSWPQYGATYRATMRGDVIRGTAYFEDGRKMGTFTLRRMR
jgi:hypothetical protein